MGRLRKIERWSKRLFIALITRTARTPKLSKEEILGGPLRRVLVVRQHNQMGDMLLAVPAFRAIKEAFVGAELGVLTATINREVLLNNPYIDHVFTYDKRRPLRLIPLIRELRRRRFDLVIVLHTVSFSFTSAMLAVLSGARFRVGSTSRPFGHGLAEAVLHLELPLPDETELGRMNESEHNLYPLGGLGISSSDLSPLLVPTGESEAWASAWLKKQELPGAVTVAVHPGAGKRQNIWPADRFAAVVNELSRRQPTNLIAVQGPRDADAVRRLLDRVDAFCAVLGGRSIGDVAAVLKRCDLVLCNDTGVLHVACAVGARTLGVFGPTDPDRWAPRCDNLHVVKAPGGKLEDLDALGVARQAAGLLGLVHRA